MGLHLAQLKFAWAQKQTIVQPKKLAPAVQPKNITLALYARLAPSSRRLSWSLLLLTEEKAAAAAAGAPCPELAGREGSASPHISSSPLGSGAAATRQIGCERWWPVHQIGAGPEKAARQRFPTSRLLQAVARRLRVVGCGNQSMEPRSRRYGTPHLFLFPDRRHDG